MKRFAIPVMLAGLGLLAWLGWSLSGARTLFAETGVDHRRAAGADSTVGAAHGAWDDFLARYVHAGEDGVNRVAYQSVTAADRARLDAYIATLESVAVTDLAEPAQLAFWINLYNALTVRVILDHYPVKSIRDIDFAWLDRGPWKKELTTVEDRALSLDDIEHRIVRPLFGDNRVHYALNCASIGCPNLRRRAYTRDNLEALLEAGARDYINHPRGVRFDGNELIASSLFKWYAEDFGGDQRRVIEHLAQYARPALGRRLAGADEIDDFFYDWSLNDG